MNVKLLTPEGFLKDMERFAAIGHLTCHANADKDFVPKEVLTRAIRAGHENTLEHINLTFSVKGLSRACLQELSRHRHISLSVESTRHTLREKLGTEADAALLWDMRNKFKNLYYNDDPNQDYVWAMVETMCKLVKQIPDIPNDELKYFVPECWPTNLILTSNIRELRHILKLRTNPAALKEFRVLAYSLFEAVPEEYRYLLKDCVYKETISYQEAVTKIPAHAVFRHFKGNLYEVLAITKDTETEKPVVIYQDIEKRGIVWARPASMWFDEVANGVKRFECVDRKESGHE